MKEYCIESKEFLKESRMLWDSLDEKDVSLFNNVSTLFAILLYTLQRQKTGAQENFIKVERSRDPILRYVHNEFQNVMVRSICICVLSLKIPRC